MGAAALMPSVPHGPRYHATETALRLAVMLRAGRWTVRSAAGELGYTYRTVYRMLHALRRLGFRVEAQREGPHVYYRVSAESSAACSG